MIDESLPPLLRGLNLLRHTYLVRLFVFPPGTQALGGQTGRRRLLLNIPQLLVGPLKPFPHAGEPCFLSALLSDPLGELPLNRPQFLFNLLPFVTALPYILCRPLET